MFRHKEPKFLGQGPQGPRSNLACPEELKLWPGTKHDHSDNKDNSSKKKGLRYGQVIRVGSFCPETVLDFWKIKISTVNSTTTT